MIFIFLLLIFLILSILCCSWDRLDDFSLASYRQNKDECFCCSWRNPELITVIYFSFFLCTCWVCHVALWGYFLWARILCRIPTHPIIQDQFGSLDLIKRLGSAVLGLATLGLALMSPFFFVASCPFSYSFFVQLNWVLDHLFYILFYFAY